MEGTMKSPPYSLLAYFLPPRCSCCHSSLHPDASLWLCEYCHYALPWLGHSCQICALPLADNSATTCGQCLQKPPAFSSARIPFRYAYPLDKLILDFKFNHGFAKGKLLSQLMIDFLQHDYQYQQLPDLLMPVPLHWWRQMKRGFNQSELLARDLSKALQIPLVHCSRRHQQQTQKESNKKTREQNLRDAFLIDRQLQNRIHGQHIAVVDDVVTTGATAREMSQALMNKGAASVVIWAIARTPLAG